MSCDCSHAIRCALEGGKPQTLATVYVDCRGVPQSMTAPPRFTHVGDELKLGQLARGRMLLTANIAFQSLAPTVDGAVLDVIVYGMVGAVRTRVMRATFGVDHLEQEFTFDEPFERFVFEAGITLLDGSGAGSIDVTSAGFLAVARAWRS